MAFFAVGALWWTLVAQKEFGVFLCFLSVVGLALWSACVAFANLSALRLKKALPALVALAITIDGILSAQAGYPAYLEWQQNRVFAAHRAEYERRVEQWRKQNRASGLTRLIVDQQEHPMVEYMADFVVFDESDAIMGDPNFFSANWPSVFGPGNFRDTVVRNEENFVRPLGQHFYYVTDANP